MTRLLFYFAAWYFNANYFGADYFSGTGATPVTSSSEWIIRARRRGRR